MKLIEIEELWNKDCVIDNHKLDDEALRTPMLHSRYYHIYLAEKIQLEKFKLELNQLLAFKWQFFSKKVDPEAQQELLKQVNADEFSEMRFVGKEIDTMIDADKQTFDKRLLVSAQQEKVEYLKSIITFLNGRNFMIKNAIDFKKFSNGLA